MERKMSGEEGYLNRGMWFKHSCTPEGDPRFDALRIEYGAEGYTVFFNALQYIYKGKCGKLEIKAIASNYGIAEDRVNEILCYMEDECEGILHRDEEGRWTSDRAAEELLKNKKAKEGKHLRNERYQEKLKQTSDSLKTVLSPTEDSLKSDYKIREDKIREDIKRNTHITVCKEKDSMNAVPQAQQVVKKPLFVSLSPPSKEEVIEFSKTLDMYLDVDSYYDFYTANGWKAGRNPMKDWKAAARNWARRGLKDNQKYSKQNPNRLTHPEIREQDLVGFEEGEL